MTKYLSKDEVLKIHYSLIEEFGGSHGLKDLGVLESALYRPQSGYYSNIIEKASALMESLTINHSFIDGNKRVAFFSTDTFLRQNGYFIDCESQLAYYYFMKLFEEHKFNFDNLSVWIKEHLRELTKF